MQHCYTCCPKGYLRFQQAAHRPWASVASQVYVAAKFDLLLTSLFLLICQVLDSGRLKEYDEPYILLQEKESLFYKMVQQVGKTEAASLTETAKQVIDFTFLTPHSTL